jgi:cardiolipin synthase
MDWILAYVAVGWVIRVAMVPVVLRRDFTPGASLAWLLVVYVHPYIGFALYLLIGESRLGRRRVERHRQFVRLLGERQRQAERHHRVARPELHPAYEPMVRQAEKISGMPTLAGNGLDLFSETGDFVTRLVADVDAARSHVHLLYFIFVDDATGERLCAALLRAAARGVACRLLVDAIGSRKFLRRSPCVRELRRAGVQVVAALPVALLRRRLARLDLRNHRKLAVIDDRVAYAGSHNLISPDYGGCSAGPWFDLTGRLTGPVVGELAAVFSEDWTFETGERLDVTLPDGDGRQGGDVLAQVVPTGPSSPGENYRQVLLAAIQCARERIVLTTPYFVPDEATLIAMMMAADRGVRVDLILPHRGDHPLTAAAGRAHLSDLLRAGVHVHLYRPGLLHAKTVTVDDAFALLGSANLDVRSFRLNFELSVLLYGPDVTERLRQVQRGYLNDSIPLDPEVWDRRPVVKKYLERAVWLLSPLL